MRVNHEEKVVAFSGVAGSGKTTVIHAIEEKLQKEYAAYGLEKPVKMNMIDISGEDCFDLNTLNVSPHLAGKYPQLAKCSALVLCVPPSNRYETLCFPYDANLRIVHGFIRETDKPVPMLVLETKADLKTDEDKEQEAWTGKLIEDMKKDLYISRRACSAGAANPQGIDELAKWLLQIIGEMPVTLSAKNRIQEDGKIVEQVVLCKPPVCNEMYTEADADDTCVNINDVFKRMAAVHELFLNPTDVDKEIRYAYMEGDEGFLFRRSTPLKRVKKMLETRKMLR